MNKKHDANEMLNKNISLVIKEKKTKKDSPYKLINLLFIILFIISCLCLIVLLIIRNLQLNDKLSYTNISNDIINSLSTIQNKIQEIESNIKELTSNKDDLIKNENKCLKTKKTLENTLTNKQYENSSLKNTRDYRDIPKISNIFTTKKEVIQILDYIKKHLKRDNFSPRITQLYKATRDGDHNSKFIRNINGKENIFIVIQTITNDIFGVFYNIPVVLEKETKSKDNNAFMFSLTLNKVFPIKENEEAYWFNKEMFFNIGRNDIFISDEFLSNTYSLNHFPSSFGVNVDEEEIEKLKGVLTSGKIGFGIRELETYQLKYQ